MQCPERCAARARTISLARLLKHQGGIKGDEGIQRFELEAAPEERLSIGFGLERTGADRVDCFYGRKIEQTVFCANQLRRRAGGTGIPQ